VEIKLPEKPPVIRNVQVVSTLDYYGERKPIKLQPSQKIHIWFKVKSRVGDGFCITLLENIQPNQYKLYLNDHEFESSCGRMAGLDLTPKPPEQGGLTGDVAGRWFKNDDWNKLTIENASSQEMAILSVWIYGESYL
jgi:hypothetical protein